MQRATVSVPMPASGFAIAQLGGPPPNRVWKVWWLTNIAADAAAGIVTGEVRLFVGTPPTGAEEPPGSDFVDNTTLWPNVSDWGANELVIQPGERAYLAFLPGTGTAVVNMRYTEHAVA